MSVSDVQEHLSATSFDNRLLAFKALQRGLRFAPTNWRMWQNYTLIALDVGEIAESARALGRLVDNGGPIDHDVLDRLVDAVMLDDWSVREVAIPKTSNIGFGLLPIVERLFDQTILPRIVDDPRVYRAHGRLLRWKEDWAGAIEDYIRAYRSAVSGSDIERDVGKWRDAVSEVEDVVGIMGVLGPKAAGKGDWRFQARGLVRTLMGRTRDA